LILLLLSAGNNITMLTANGTSVTMLPPSE